MCGLAGYFDYQGIDSSAEGICLAMTSKLIHRGPDDAGTWLNLEHGIALGHQEVIDTGFIQ